MKVLFIEDVEGVAHGGDVKEVKRGFAKNYLLPQNMAVLATKASLERIPKLQTEADKTRIQKLNDMKELATEINGLRVNLAMRSGPNGKLYGSVTNNLIASELSGLSAKEIQRKMIVLPESIRQIGIFEIKVNLHAEVEVNISVLVHPEDMEPSEFEESLAKKETSEEPTEDTPSSVVAENTLEENEIPPETEESLAVEKEK
jgi:large subunit ribosomal protein L9